jgi:hypothetical protein
MASMWKHLNRRALPLGIVSILAAHVSQGFGAEDEDQAIRRVEDQIEEATGKNDADALSRIWASDYVCVNPRGKQFTGAERLQVLRRGEMPSRLSGPPSSFGSAPLVKCLHVRSALL